MKNQIANLENEIWKPIKNYENIYEVSNYGRIKRVKYLEKLNTFVLVNEKLITFFKKGWKDYYVPFCVNSIVTQCKVKNIVVQAFIRDITNKETIINIDGDYTNNKLENLKIVDKNLNKIPYEIGYKLNYLEICQKVPSKGRTKYLCKCVCGKEKIFTSHSLRRSLDLNCGCMNNASENHKNRKYDPQTSCLRTYYSTYKYSAKNRNLEFKLSFEDCLILFKQNCYYCGDYPVERQTIHPSDIKNNKNKFKSKNKDKFVLIANGIDRIDSSKGYTIENCQPCCEQCNRMKLDYTQEEFINKVNKIYKNFLI